MRVVFDDAIDAGRVAGEGDGGCAVAVTHCVRNGDGELRIGRDVLAPAVGVGEDVGDNFGSDMCGHNVGFADDGANALRAVDGACVERFGQRLHADDSDDVACVVGNDGFVIGWGFEGATRRAVGFDSDEVDVVEAEGLCRPLGFDATHAASLAATAADDDCGGSRDADLRGAGQRVGGEDER